MKNAITWHDGIIEATTEGDASLAEMTGMIAGILSHEKWRRGGAVLVDHSRLNAAPLTLGQVRALADLAAESREQVGTTRIAHLVERDLEFGLVRMWESFVENQWDARIRCFRSRDEALAWLKEPR